MLCWYFGTLIRTGHGSTVVSAERRLWVQFQAELVEGTG